VLCHPEWNSLYRNASLGQRLSVVRGGFLEAGAIHPLSAVMTSTEEQEMQGINPRSRDELKEEQEFLKGESTNEEHHHL